MSERWTQDEIDADMFRYDDDVCPDCNQLRDMCYCNDGSECGRWSNGRLTRWCSKAGSEECDFECPYRASLYAEGRSDG